MIRVESFAGLAAAGAARPGAGVVPQGADPCGPGDFVAATARLLPPPEAARPGGYDFARDAYFRGIGAVGSLVGAVAIRAPTEPPPLHLRLAACCRRRPQRADPPDRRRPIGGQAGAVAAALVTGKRGLIERATNDVLRAAGIYHVVSISGLHMVLAAGVVFWLVRAVLALVPYLRAGLADQEDRGRLSRMAGRHRLLRLLGLGRRGRALADHDPGDAGRDPGRPAGAVACATSRSPP